MEEKSDYLPRNMDAVMDEWFTTDRQHPLLIVGARQVGKSETIKHFLQERRSIKIDFSLNETADEGALKTFLRYRGNSDLLNSLAIFDSEAGELQPGETIFFFDEIQLLAKGLSEEDRQAKIVERLKEITVDSRYFYIFSGSLLGSAISNYGLLKESLGFRVEKMYPMNLLEFDRAVGFSQEQINAAKGAFLGAEPLSSELHERFLKAFGDYVYVGGFPNSVKAFIQAGRHSIGASAEVIKGIVLTYQDDILKYYKKDNGRQLLQEMLSCIVDDMRKPQKDEVMKTDFLNRELFELLAQSDIGLIVPRKGGSHYDDDPKAYFNDVGFMMGLCFDGPEFQSWITAKSEEESHDWLLGTLSGETEHKENMGWAYEQAVAEELKTKISNKIVNDIERDGRDLEYLKFGKGNSYEIEFLWREKATDGVYAIEVKSGKTEKRQSIEVYARKSGCKGILFSNNREICSCPERLSWYPIYALAFVDEKTLATRKTPETIRKCMTKDFLF
jgi:predicted AAA+ superfamily ATPase